MDTLNVRASSSDGRAAPSGDALKVLGRVADAFDNPSLHKTDKQVLFVVNVVKSRRLLASDSSEKSMCQDMYDSSFESSYDEDVELVELGDASVREHASSYPYASRRCPSQEPRSYSERIFRKENGMYDITQMLLTSSPLDRLDHLARMELKRTGWFERTDKWSVVEMGLPAIPLPMTPPKTPSKHASVCVSSANMTSPKDERRRPETGGVGSPSGRERDHDTPERKQYRGGGIKSSTPTTPVRSQESISCLADFSTLSYGDTPGTSHGTPVRASSRLSGAIRRTQISQRHVRGRLGRVVRNFVKKMLPPSAGDGASIRSASYPRAGAGQNGHTEMTPRSNTSGESGWTFASAGSRTAAGGRGCLDYQATNRWSGFWH